MPTCTVCVQSHGMRGAISKKGKVLLLFIDIEVKIDQHYYISHILQYHLLQHAKNLYTEEYFCFQQDSAPYVLYFLTPQDWPASIGQNWEKMPQQLVCAACMSFTKRC
jgi:hypothetical protein